MLYTGAIIIDKETVFAITTEVHCRSKTTDIHGETNLKPLVSSSTCVYGSLSIGIFEESDSKATKKKLKIGSKQRDPSTAVESPCSVHSINLNSARQSCMEEFIATMKHESMTYSPTQTLTSLHQLPRAEKIYYYYHASI
jgi:hypothetical protein